MSATRMYKFSTRIKFSLGILLRFCLPAGLSLGSCRRVFLCGILERTVSLVGLLPRCGLGIFLGMDPARKSCHLGRRRDSWWDPARIQASISNASQGSFKVVFKYRVFVIYPQTVQAQYVTVDSMGDSRKYPYPTTLGINILNSPCLWKFQNALPHLPPCPPNSKIINLSSSPLEFPIFFRPFGIPV